MQSDAHCHPFDLERVFPEAEGERQRLKVCCAASATSAEEFAYHEELARNAQTAAAPPLLPCFALHPQLPALNNDAAALQDGLGLLENLAKEGRLAAVGETGFDLYNTAYRETEKIQDQLFAAHLETALRHNLPMVLHVRRAMHKIFGAASSLKKCPAVIFHSWPGTAAEGEALLRRGVNAYFSFGTAVMLNHREAMRCAAVFPRGRLLTETDAPYQNLRGKGFSQWEDLPRILESIAALRRDAGKSGESAGELEKIIEANFYAAFGK